ncbi:MAG TPA: response regulator [Pyrinomonadaceae bacterium]|nr:response regulator [Pyrinomonadaceae bacterium]
MRTRRKQLIMIADRDEDERRLLKAVLKLSGFRVVEAADGLEVIRLAQTERPDLMVLDLTLPRAAEAIRRVRKDSILKHRPVVTVSTKPRSSWQRHLSERSQMHLNKPVRLESFCEFIKVCLSSSETELAMQ